MSMMEAKAAEAELIAYAAAMPGAWEDHPWDHTVLKVGSKIFVFFGGAASAPDVLSVTVNLPISAEMALTLDYVKPAGHGMGKYGWVQVTQRTGDLFDLETIRGWILQSYKAIAPRKIARGLDA
jgi:predicted DNA-binding protein (MmcQ/YjbR family)